MLSSIYVVTVKLKIIKHFPFSCLFPLLYGLILLLVSPWSLASTPRQSTLLGCCTCGRQVCTCCCQSPAQTSCAYPETEPPPLTTAFAERCATPQQGEPQYEVPGSISHSSVLSHHLLLLPPSLLLFWLSQHPFRSQTYAHTVLKIEFEDLFQTAGQQEKEQRKKPSQKNQQLLADKNLAEQR